MSETTGCKLFEGLSS